MRALGLGLVIAAMGLGVWIGVVVVDSRVAAFLGYVQGCATAAGASLFARGRWP